MKVTLYMAISIDGFIAKKDGDSEWVSPVDSENFEAKIKEKGCIVLGRRTFDQYRRELYPVKGVTNIVLSSKAPDEKVEGTIFATSPREALRVAEEKGHSEVLLIGGGRTNGALLNENLIDELILSVHPLVLGEGIKLFEGSEENLDLELLHKQRLSEGLIQLYYEVKGNL
jgi:dihydrofolate reductase